MKAATSKKKTAETIEVPEGVNKTFLEFVLLRTKEYSDIISGAAPAEDTKKQEIFPHIDPVHMKTQLRGISNEIRRALAVFLGLDPEYYVEGSSASGGGAERLARREKYPTKAGVAIVATEEGHNYVVGKAVLTMGVGITDSGIDVKGEDWDICLKANGTLGNHIAVSAFRPATEAEIIEFMTEWGTKGTPLLS